MVGVGSKTILVSSQLSTDGMAVTFYVSRQETTEEAEEWAED